MNERKESRAARKMRALNGETLLAAVRWVVDARIFDELKFHGNTSWKPADLVVLTVVWAWSESRTLCGAFDEARLRIGRMDGKELRHQAATKLSISRATASGWS